MKDNWKWAVIATVVILVTFGFIFGLAFACRKRSAKQDLAEGDIPLQILATLPPRPTTPTAQQDGPSGLHGMPAISPSPPLEGGMGPVLRRWAAEEADQEVRRENTRRLGRAAARYCERLEERRREQQESDQGVGVEGERQGAKAGRWRVEGGLRGSRAPYWAPVNMVVDKLLPR